MKNLKKTLAVVLAFAMILSMGFSAFAYTDVTAGTKVAEAVGILSNLNIFTGFEDGTFKPNDTVTRAQMAAIICRTLGYEDQAVASTGTTNFYDVAASHWASGYINVAESLQIVNGYGNGAFGPEDQVTYEQAIKMIVVALGYELDAQAKGGWSTGYLAVAAREGITKNSNGVVGTPAARGTIAVLVYNSLEVPLMDQDTWTPSGKEDEFAKLQETILSRYLDVTKIEAVVSVVPYATFANSGYEADADQKVTFDTSEGAKAKEYGFEGTSKVYKAIDYARGTDTFDASLVPEINNMAGRKVVAYVGNEQDEELGDLAVYAVAEKQGANKVTVLSATQLTTDTDELTIEYKEVGSKVKKTLDLEEAIIPVINFGTENTEEDTPISNTAELAELVGSAGIITLISNDANSKIDEIFVTVYSEEAVIEEVNEEDGLISFESYTEDDLYDVDTEDEDVLYVVIKDGVIASVKDIAANDTVSVVGGEVGLHESFNLYYVSSKTVTGRVDAYGDDSVEIGGEDYELSPEYADSLSSLSGKEGIFFLNVDGKIAHDEATADKNYGIVIGAGKEGRKNMIDVVLADGTAATYELKDNVKLGEDATDTAVLATLQGLMSEGDSDWKEAVAGDLTGLVYDITVKNGKVTKLVAVASADDDASKEYDEENMEYGKLSFNDSTIVVSVKEEFVTETVTEEVEGEEVESEVIVPAAIEADDIKIGKVADFFVDGEGEDFTVYAYDYDNNEIAGLVIGYGLSSAIAQDSAAVIITDYRTKDINDEIAYVINGFQDGKKVTYTILDEDFDGTTADFAAGNVILVGAANADGMISDLEVLLAKGESAFALEGGIADKEDEYYYYGDLDESQEPTASKFFLVEDGLDQAINPANVTVMDGEEVVIQGKEYVAAEGISMRNAARYTLVDFSVDEDEPAVSKKSKGTGLFSRYETTGKYDYKVFVRYFDDAQVEVVVYRYARPAAPVEE